MKNKLKLAALSFIVLTAVSCKKDKQDPTIEIEEPLAGESYSSGSEMHVEITFADDRDLASYVVSIGNEAGDTISGLSFSYSGDISGKSYFFHDHVVVPTTLTPPYYLHAAVTDAEGKTTSTKIELTFTP